MDVRLSDPGGVMTYITGNDFPVPRHQREDVTKGLLNRILKQSGIKDQ